MTIAKITQSDIKPLDQVDKINEIIEGKQDYSPNTVFSEHHEEEQILYAWYCNTINKIVYTYSPTPSVGENPTEDNRLYNRDGSIFILDTYEQSWIYSFDTDRIHFYSNGGGHENKHAHLALRATYADIVINYDELVNESGTPFDKINLVKKTGDTMSGDLEVLNPLGQSSITLRCPVYNYEDENPRSGWQTFSTFKFTDYANRIIGWVQSWKDANITGTSVGARRKINETEYSANIKTWVDFAGNAHSSFPKTDCCDGQWVVLDASASANILLNNASLTQSSNQDAPKTVNLPNDGHLYEVMLRGGVTTNSSSGSYLVLQFHSTAFADTVYCCGARTRSNSTQFARGTVIIPMKYGSNNLLVSRNSAWSGTADLVVIAYRRIGTNT